jgi:hypothetical protein
MLDRYSPRCGFTIIDGFPKRKDDVMAAPKLGTTVDRPTVKPPLPELA